jgi:hypothetical protein
MFWIHDLGFDAELASMQNSTVALEGDRRVVVQAGDEAPSSPHLDFDQVIL